MNNFEYTTIEQQIVKLKGQQLIIGNESFARWALQTYGYYNIINGYREPYITSTYNKKTYSQDVSFEQIFSLFKLDHNIRNSIMLAMVDLEEHLRAVVADIIGEAFGSDTVSYLEKNNYRDRTVNNPKFRRNNLLNSLTKLAHESYKEPIRYYRDKYNIIPPWILLKGTDFGTLVNYIRLFKKEQREKLIYALYGNKANAETMDSFKELLYDSLSLCLEYRNLAAHGGRIYNYIPNSSIRDVRINAITAGLGKLLRCLNLFAYKQPYRFIENMIDDSVSDYCSAYPHDIHRLEQAIGTEIEVSEVVWINNTSTKYHSNPHCSGMQHVKQIQLSEAAQQGYTPCKRCCE